jgi:hypothetical protein
VLRIYDIETTEVCISNFDLSAPIAQTYAPRQPVSASHLTRNVYTNISSLTNTPSFIHRPRPSARGPPPPPRPPLILVMPTDDYDARALALPLDDESSEPTSSPRWSRRSASFRRNDSPFSSRPATFRERLVRNAEKLQRRALGQYHKLSPVQKVLFSVGGITVFVLSILFLVYNERIFQAMLPFARRWRDVTAGWLILWALIFVVSFPPLIGYSTLLTIAGFVYGFPNGYAFSTPFHQPRRLSRH